LKHYIIKSKRLILICLFSSLFLSLIAQTPVIKVACIGNSITAGTGIVNPTADSYPAVLQRLLGAGYEVKNFGQGGKCMLHKGDNPYWYSSVYYGAKSYIPDIVIIKLGTNDSKAVNQPFLNEFEADMSSFVDIFRALTSKPKIYLCIPSPVFGSNAYGISDSVIVNIITPHIRNVAALKNTELINIRPALVNHPELFPDKVHPNEAGAVLIANVVSAALLPQTTQIILPMSDQYERVFLKGNSLILDLNSNKRSIVHVFIFNISGMLVKQFTDVYHSGILKEYSLASLPKGIYLAKVDAEDNIKTTKLVIK